MAPMKRKDVHKVSNDRPHKKSRPSISTATILKEEAPFPRGGGDALTPLEHKQIQIQAKQDVLFEQSTGQKVSRVDLEDEDVNQEDQFNKRNTKNRTKSKGQPKRKAVKSTDLAKEEAVKIEGLSYKRLVPGSLVLGQVSQVNRHDIALSLPNNLTGYVPLASISDRLTQRLENVADDNREIGKDDEEDTQFDMKLMFSIGQYLRAYVVSTEDEGAAGPKIKRHITLSIIPRQANAGLTKADLVTNSVIQASVLSVEDHGFRMDLGLEDRSVHGFMALKDVGKDLDRSKAQEGQTLLCLITGQNPNGKTIKLSVDQAKIGNVKKGMFLTEAPTVDALLPGTAVEFLVSFSESTGLAGKFMGLLNVTADLIHSRAASGGTDLQKRFPVGSKAKGRIICTFPTSGEKKLGISLQNHVLQWKTKEAGFVNSPDQRLPTDLLPTSSFIDHATVAKVEPSLGLFLEVGIKGVQGFAHISKITDGKIDVLSEDAGSFRLGSTHRARIIGYNHVDGLFILSMQPKVLSQLFLRLEDIDVGQIVHGTVEKILVDGQGVKGLIVNIAEGISGLVPESHLADIRLQHPERKFKEGNPVKARVLSIDPYKRQMRLTLKKTLVNSEKAPWKLYKDLKPDMQSPGTLINVLANGAVVQFYGSVRAFLPVSEMSETYIGDPREHFHPSQVVNVRVVTVEPEEQRLIVSCKDPSTFGEAQREAFQDIKVGSTVEGTVREKTHDHLTIHLRTGLKAMLPIDHLTDGTQAKSASTAKRIRIDQNLNQLLVLSKDMVKQRIRLSSKPSLIKAAFSKELPSQFEDVEEGAEVVGYVNNITSTGVFVQFGGNLSALVMKRHLPTEAVLLQDFGMRRSQTVRAKVLSIDHSQARFLLSMKGDDQSTDGILETVPTSNHIKLSNPVDEAYTSPEDFTLGKVTKVKINSVKDTQLNVQLADGIQGRIDVSSMFDTWEDINDKKHPLRTFHPRQILPARILGMYDSRNHRFLPITHRTKAPVFELTAKRHDLEAPELDVLTLDKVQAASSWIVFVNNVAEDCLWVNLSPNVRGRIRAKDVSDDISVLTDLASAFPIGTAIRAKVLKVDIEKNRLDLTARTEGTTSSMTLESLVQGQVLPGRITKVTDRQIIVQLSEHVSGPLHLIDMADDFSKASPWIYTKNQMIRVCVKEIDLPNKKLALSSRPSLVLSSSLPIEDPDVSSAKEVEVNDVRRGFVRSVADNGIFVALSSQLTAFVRVADLSDLYIKDWKVEFQVDQLVKGKILAVDAATNHVQMSLKKSHLDKDYKPPLVFNDVYIGRVVTGKVRKVEDFGVFVVFDDSANISGLCHRSNMSDRKGPDPRKLYEEGDLVKAKVLSVDKTKRRISLGLKASFFEASPNAEDNDVVMIEADNSGDDGRSTNEDGEHDANDTMSTGTFPAGLDEDIASFSDGSENGIALAPEQDLSDYTQPTSSLSQSFKGLSTGGFDWTGTSTFSDHEPQSDTSTSSLPRKKKKKKQPSIRIDHTGDLDTYGPQSTADYERLLLGQPNSSALWLGYMAFYLQLGEVDTARTVAERALKTIYIREESDKLNVWIGLLNLENAYGTDERLDDVFKRACIINDPLDVSERLISTYIQSQKYDKADELFQATLKKHTQSPALWLNYAQFLMSTLSSPDRARALLPRAMQALPNHTHVNLTSQVAKIEFDCPSGDPERGRTIFEQLIATWPKRLDLWNVLLDLEIKNGEMERVRALFERVTHRTIGLKPRKAKFFFKKWASFEEKNGSQKEQERVKGLAEAYVKDWQRRKEV